VSSGRRETPILEIARSKDFTLEKLFLAGLGGALLAKYNELGGVSGSLGYPVSDATVGGRQLFANQAALAGKNPAPKHARVAPRNPLQNPYCAKDGRWLHLNMPQADRYWPNACKALGLDAIRDDPRFETLVLRQRHSAELVLLIEAAIAQRTREEWAPILDQHDLVWAPVQDVHEVIADPQVRANRYIVAFDHPNFGPFETIDTPARFGTSRVGARGPAPELGQHTEEVLLERGLSWDEIGRLRDSGALGPP